MSAFLNMPSQVPVSFVLLAYNQQAYIRQAVEGALSQTFGPLEIILSDDNSTDDTFKVMEGMASSYSGAHKIVLNRNPLNLGLIRHIEKAVGLATGEWVTVAAGDDVSHPSRVLRLCECVTAAPSIRAAYSSVLPIDAQGTPHETEWDHTTPIHPRDASESIRRDYCAIYGCSAIYHRSCFGLFGPMTPDIVHEDHVLPFRALLLGDIAFVDRPLVSYRFHQNNMFNAVGTMSRDARLAAFVRKVQGDLAVREQWLTDAERVGGISASDRAAMVKHCVPHRAKASASKGAYVRFGLQCLYAFLRTGRFSGMKTLFWRLRLIRGGH
jgi:glycosyltransferase involved in cell wall biosynthesis